jgi:serine/threonine protein kinase
VIEHGSNRYLIGEALGRGSYGATYACTDQWSNSLVVKVLIPNQQTYEQVRLNWHREITSLLTLRHPNITYVYDAFELSHTFHIVMERCGGSVTTLFSLPDYDGDDWLLPIARCMLQAIGYMHDHGYVHKDIHLRNLFWTYLRNELMPHYSQSVTFKIGDLGVSRLEGEIRHFRPTIPWMVAPEVLDEGRFGPAGKPTDIYHAGWSCWPSRWGSNRRSLRKRSCTGFRRKRRSSCRRRWGPRSGSPASEGRSADVSSHVRVLASSFASLIISRRSSSGGPLVLEFRRLSERPLPPSFYDRDVVQVARELIGSGFGGQNRNGLVVGRIVETEAYLASDDTACHAARGKTRKNASMFGPPGRAYVYPIHARWCFNVVTEPRWTWPVPC